MRYLFLFVFWPFLASAGEKNPEMVELIRFIEENTPVYLDQFQAPGAAVALIANGEIIYEKGFGYQDVAKSRRVDVQTGFNIGSISKTVAAWAVMSLVEEGRIELDAPISRYVTRWKLPSSSFDPDGVTIARLLSHTAGLSLHGYPGFPPDAKLPSLEASLSGEINTTSDGVTQIMEPGTKFKYSGGGYTLLQLMIEEVTGQSFEDYARERILEPLGMKFSDYHLSKELLARASEAHDLLGNKTDYIRFTAQAAAGLQSTVHDLALFGAATLPGPNGEPPGRGVLKRETIETMLKPALDGKSPTALGYFAPEVEIRLRGHGGDNTGWHAQFEVALDKGIGIVVLTNADGGAAVRGRLLCEWRNFLGVEKEPCKIYSLGLLMNRLKHHGVKDLNAWYEEAQKKHADEIIFHEMINNYLGITLADNDRLEQAVALLKLNTELYPGSFNTWDSLGYAYMKAGKIDSALENYQKSVEMNPENEEGKRYIKELLEKKTAKAQ